MDTVVNKVDSKGRVSLPSDYRSIVKELSTEIVCYRSLTSPCIEGCPEELLEKLASDMENSLDFFSQEQDDLTNLIFGSLYPSDSTESIIPVRSGPILPTHRTSPCMQLIQSRKKHRDGNRDHRNYNQKHHLCENHFLLTRTGDEKRSSHSRHLCFPTTRIPIKRLNCAFRQKNGTTAYPLCRFFATFSADKTFFQGKRITSHSTESNSLSAVQTFHSSIYPIGPDRSVQPSWSAQSRHGCRNAGRRYCV